MFVSLQPGKQFFSNVGTSLPVLYQKVARINVSHNAVRPMRLNLQPLNLKSKLPLSPAFPIVSYG